MPRIPDISLVPNVDRAPAMPNTGEFTSFINRVHGTGVSYGAHRPDVRARGL